MGTKKPIVSKSGTLRIGNQWNAINIIARSQTHPLKAVCELVENAIDARATHIQIIRRRREGDIYLELWDDGTGVQPNEEGEPDFARIATHVCDSMKRHLAGRDREGVHGEFGIGLLSFWSLGKELRMISAAPNGRLFEMHLIRGKRNYAVRAVRRTMLHDGTCVVVGPLLESTRNIVTGEKLVRYLSTELRDRLRSCRVHVRVTDRIARKDLVVQPREFEGERLELPDIATSLGTIRVELYFHGDQRGQRGEVAVCKDGTRVLKDITELIHFQHSPWTDGRLEGILDFPHLNVAPGTRSGVVPDRQLYVFAQAVATLEAPLLAAIQQREQAESDKANRDILRQVQKAFVSALRELPDNEYVFFDLPDPAHAVGRAARNGKPRDGDDGLPLAATVNETGAPYEEALPLFVPAEPGPLASVRITPRRAQRRPGEPCELTATARDELRAKIDSGVAYHWRVADGEARLSADHNQAVVTGDDVGPVTVEVTASQGDRSATDQVTLIFVENPLDLEDSTRGLPSYRLEPEHGRPWRSRYDTPRNEIVINSAHRDFLASRASAAKHRRYIGKLYAKEVVLINFPHESANDVMERLIELTLRTEEVL